LQKLFSYATFNANFFLKKYSNTQHNLSGLGQITFILS